MSSSAFRRTIAGVVISLGLVGCGSSRGLDGVYHGAPGSPITITLKGNKATVLIGNESKTLDYKVEGNKLTIVNPREGDLVLTINDDGTLTSELGVLTKNKS